MSLHQKELVEELRIQWKRLWQERVDDKVRAEGVATADYCDLFVDQGTIIHATRDFQALNFKKSLSNTKLRTQRGLFLLTLKAGAGQNSSK